MARTLGPLSAETSQAESAKFTSPLVFVHGLWDEAASWRRVTSFMSHRGWRCIAVGWSSDNPHGQSLEARATSLRSAISNLDEQPILVGHDLGAHLALSLSDLARATIAMAPLIPASIATSSALAASGSWLQRVRGADRMPGKLRDHYPVAIDAEPQGLIEELSRAGATLPSPTTDTPRLIITGAEDSLIKVDEAQGLAQSFGAEIQTVPGHHSLHTGDGWEHLAGTCHRWLIKNLGEELLALYDEAWADRDS